MTRADIIDRLASGPLLSGLRNCHHKGLHSVVLDERRDGSLSRIFMATDVCSMDRIFRTDGHMVVGAHNHDKGIKFTLLYGEAWHVTLNTDAINSNSDPWYRYEFTSAIDSGSFGLLTPRKLMVSVGITNLDGTYMDVHAIHTVMCQPWTAWHCDEGPKQPVKKHVWSPRPDLVLDPAGLYLSMDEPELETMRQILLNKARRV